MSRFYSVEAKDVAGNTRFWVDSYPTVKLACDDAKKYKRDHPFHTVKVFKEMQRPAGHQFGAQWQVFREILR